MKNLLLIYGALRLGGIETLIVRMAKAWRARGVTVTVLLLTRKGDPGLLAELAQHARIVYLSELALCPAALFEHLSLFGWLAPLSHRRSLALVGDVDHIHFFDSLSMLMAFRLLARTGLRKKVTGGVYHQNEYAFPHLRRAYFSDCLAALFRQVPPERNVIFFNEISKRTLASDYGTSFAGAPLLPIGIDLSNLAMRPLDEVDRKQVVSIGRITSFKTYNFEFLRTVRESRQRGDSLRYDVYGDGDQLSRLKARIAELGLEDAVCLRGPLPYSQFVEAIRSSLVFLGSGTALIEAAACGVPAMIGIESQEDDQTYGFLHEMPGLSYHEKGLPVATRSYGECVAWLASLGPAEYAEVCRRSRDKAKEFSIDIFIERFIAADAGAAVLDGTGLGLNTARFLASITRDRLAGPGAGGTSFWSRYDVVRD